MSLDFKIQLRQALAAPLPGTEAQARMTPLQPEEFKKAGLQTDHYRASSVSLVIFPEDGAHHLILIQRPEYEGTHSGQVSFPGGKMDPDDPNLLFTAIRECQEETGILLEHTHHLGALTEVYIPVSGFKVLPHVFYLNQRPVWQADPREVAAIFTIQVHDLLKSEVIKRTQIPVGKGYTLKNVPYFDLADKIIWGATAVILSEFRELLRS